jgi:hypothetical protein
MPEVQVMKEPLTPAQVKQIQHETLSAELLEKVKALQVGERDILVFHAPHELHAEARVTCGKLAKAVQEHTHALVLVLEPGWTLEKLGPDHLEALGLQRVPRPLVSSRGPVNG